VVVAATVGATAVFLVARTAIDDVLRVKAEPVPHKRRYPAGSARASVDPQLHFICATKIRWLKIP